MPRSRVVPLSSGSVRLGGEGMAWVVENTRNPGGKLAISSRTSLFSLRFSQERQSRCPASGFGGAP